MLNEIYRDREAHTGRALTLTWIYYRDKWEVEVRWIDRREGLGYQCDEAKRGLPISPGLLCGCVPFWQIVEPCYLMSLVGFRLLLPSAIGNACFAASSARFHVPPVLTAGCQLVSHGWEGVCVWWSERSAWNLLASGIHPLHNKPAHMPLSFLLLCHPNLDGSLFWWSVPVAPNGKRDGGRLWSLGDVDNKWMKGGWWKLG